MIQRHKEQKSVTEKQGSKQAGALPVFLYDTFLLKKRAGMVWTYSWVVSTRTKTTRKPKPYGYAHIYIYKEWSAVFTRISSSTDHHKNHMPAPKCRKKSKNGFCCKVLLLNLVDSSLILRIFLESCPQNLLTDLWSLSII
jgi:hypothetical protein